MTASSTSLRTLLLGNRFRRGLLKTVYIYSALFVYAVLFLLPFYWMLNTSLKEPLRVFQIPPDWYPNPVVFRNYLDAWVSDRTDIAAEIPVYNYAKNTAIITVNGVIATTFSSALIAYAFARMDFPGKQAMFLGVISTLMIPFTVLMVPQFILWKNLNWLDTFLPLMVPYWFGSAWNVFLLRQFFMTIPLEYDESARIDGATHWTIFSRLIVPLSKPALGAIGVLAFVFFWNDFLGPLIILSKPQNFTLTMYLANFSVAFVRTTPWHLYMAASLTIISPCLILFFFSQRAFIQGITITDFKR
ncbi:MAG: carbohydrate ABC transporter permease [Caldilineaceae bacterium SB0665_bin_21]|nr:carbohydrate ABC transporter permease [Caldilineaceae bacterium SB0665_bin_21]MYA05260.1 carbohydrate ABC transporter permease [Caldilineaceae bacterium SB0664_bin_22]MYC61251.1 carbohydrate ABC transporter permease [Caldilineaceae bacterium SB0661_bin_34]